MRTTEEGFARKKPFKVFGGSNPTGPKTLLMQRYSPDVLIKINDLTQAQFWFL